MVGDRSKEAGGRERTGKRVAFVSLKLGKLSEEGKIESIHLVRILPITNLFFVAAILTNPLSTRKA